MVTKALSHHIFLEFRNGAKPSCCPRPQDTAPLATMSSAIFTLILKVSTSDFRILLSVTAVVNCWLASVSCLKRVALSFLSCSTCNSRSVNCACFLLLDRRADSLLDTIRLIRLVSDDLPLRLHRPPPISTSDSLSESDSVSRAWFPEIVSLGLAATKTMW